MTLNIRSLDDLKKIYHIPSPTPSSTSSIPSSALSNLSPLRERLYSYSDGYLAIDIQTNERLWMRRISFINCHQFSIPYEAIEVDIQKLKQLQHKSIETLIDAFYVTELREFRLIFPYLDGLTLKELTWRFPAPSITDQLKWMNQTMLALNYLHNIQMMRHGNLNPSTIKIIKNNVILIGIDLPSLKDPVDFGYCSYERCMTSIYDERDDIWAFGLVFAELLLQLKLDSKNLHFNQTEAKIEGSLSFIVAECLHASLDIGSIIENVLQHPQSKRPFSDSIVTKLDSILVSRNLEQIKPTPVAPIHFGANDVIHVENFLEEACLHTLLIDIQDMKCWSEVRQGSSHYFSSVQAVVQEDGTVPLYRCPESLSSDTQFQTVNFHPSISLLKSRIESRTGAHFNWCQIVKYDQNLGKTGFVSEKNFDVSIDSPIAHFFLGCRKDFFLKSKKRAYCEKQRNIGNKIMVHNNSLLLVGPNTYLSYLYSIGDERRSLFDEFDYFITIIFRNVETYYCPRYEGIDKNCLFGLGVPGINSKSQMILNYYGCIVKRHCFTALGALVGLISSICTTSLLSFFLDYRFTTDSSLIKGVTVFSGVMTRWYLISTTKMNRNLRKWRYMAVFRLMNFLPLNFSEAMRLLENASYIELKQMLDAEGEKMSSTDAESPSIYDFDENTHTLTTISPPLELKPDNPS